jgi:hypothetical protein
MREETNLENSLALWDNVYSIECASFDNWKEQTLELLRQTIHQSPYPEYEPEMQRKIVEIYNRNFEYFGGIADFGDIMDDINDYNDDILYRMAEIQFRHDGYHDNKNMSKEDGIAEVQRCLWEWHNYDMFERLEGYVFNFLTNNGFMFLIPDSYYTHERFFPNSDDASIVVNDCQNILFSSFLESIEEEVSSHYTRKQDVLTVWGGIKTV